MNRKIKFRVWSKHNHTMDYDTGHKVDKDLFEIMQFTGLKDKNGVEIYEGDVYHQGDKNILYKVIFRGDCFVGNQIGNKSLAGLKYFIKDIAVIGNIYENPELLK